GGVPTTAPELVLIIGDLDNLEDDEATLELVGLYGPAHRVRLLAATTNPTALSEDVAGYFGTRMVLQTLDDQESIQLLGQPDAADLGSGDLLVRVDGRSPVRVQGLQVSPDHLDDLVRVMAETYADQPRTRRQVADRPIAADRVPEMDAHEEPE